MRWDNRHFPYLLFYLRLFMDQQLGGLIPNIHFSEASGMRESGRDYAAVNLKIFLDLKKTS